MKITPPGQDAPLVDDKGRLTPIWYEKLKALFERDKLSALTDIDVTALANGDVLIWNATTGKFEPGAN